LYGILAECYGSGQPVAFLLIKSPETSIPHAKSRYIQAILDYMISKFRLRIIGTHTDKDLEEIRACQHCCKDATHQLCFWHALKAVKARLKDLRRAPAHYDVDKAQLEFPWIDPMFLPHRQGGVSAFLYDD
jgi:hypothetical protein